jgi:hypothetical protein
MTLVLISDKSGSGMDVPYECEVRDIEETVALQGEVREDNVIYSIRRDIFVLDHQRIYHILSCLRVGTNFAAC